MRELVLFISRSLVDHPDQVEVIEVESERGLILQVKVAPEDVGKVIGKQGRIARAIRSIVKAASSREPRRIMVDILSD
ncbi:MAG: KH domain-containing protein [Firmicutes bacterium]|nr:KH domain-containing protein [Bacillota bacterium]